MCVMFSCFRPKKGGADEPLYCDSHRKPVANGSMRESDNTMDLFDLIARTQNSRIDDQRAELPGGIQVCAIVIIIFFSTENLPIDESS